LSIWSLLADLCVSARVCACVRVCTSGASLLPRPPQISRWVVEQTGFFCSDTHGDQGPSPSKQDARSNPPSPVRIVASYVDLPITHTRYLPYATLHHSCIDAPPHAWGQKRVSCSHGSMCLTTPSPHTSSPQQGRWQRVLLGQGGGPRAEGRVADQLHRLPRQVRACWHNVRARACVWRRPDEGAAVCFRLCGAGRTWRSSWWAYTRWGSSWPRWGSHRTRGQPDAMHAMWWSTPLHVVTCASRTGSFVPKGEENLTGVRACVCACARWRQFAV
jgi:hypothetical protein